MSPTATSTTPTLRVEFRSSYQGQFWYRVNGAEYVVRTALPDFVVQEINGDSRLTPQQREAKVAEYTALIGTVRCSNVKEFPPASVVAAIAADLTKGATFAILVGARYASFDPAVVVYDGPPPPAPVRAARELLVPWATWGFR